MSSVTSTTTRFLFTHRTNRSCKESEMCLGSTCHFTTPGGKVQLHPRYLYLRSCTDHLPTTVPWDLEISFTSPVLMRG